MTRRISLDFDDNDLALITDVAKASGMSRSSFIRHAALKAASPVSPKDLTEVLKNLSFDFDFEDKKKLKKA